MSIRTMTIVAVLWVISLFAVGKIVQAQVYGVNPVPPTVLAGSDVGIRVHGEQNGVPVGMPVVRVNGQWVEVRLAPSEHTKLIR